MSTNPTPEALDMAREKLAVELDREDFAREAHLVQTNNNGLDDLDIDWKCAVRAIASALSTTSDAIPVEEVKAIAQGLWLDLSEKDDRTSPEDYPEMALITEDEMHDAVRYAISALRPLRAPDEARLREAVLEEAARVADSLFYSDETKISASIRDAILALKAPR